MNFNEAVCNTLDSLHVSKTYIGYDYIIYGLKLLYEDYDRITSIVKSLYIEIADKYSTSWSCVEKDIRRTVQNIWKIENDEMLKRIFGKSSSEQRITNKEFFRGLSVYVLHICDSSQMVDNTFLKCPITQQYCKAFSDYCFATESHCG